MDGANLLPNSPLFLLLVVYYSFNYFFPLVYHSNLFLREGFLHMLSHISTQKLCYGESYTRM